MNRLKNQKSSYLLQHADNPVNWYPWCEEAFNEAKKKDIPILLSIGYSACHWCHVMAHESFEDPKIAKLMNEKYINIKLDKEERPDLDKIYQTSQTIITGKTGGWPLTVFMTPDKFPFFAGTYFPIEEKFGLPSFRDILTKVEDFYKNNKKDIQEQNIQISNIFKSLNSQSKTKNIIDMNTVNLTKQMLSDSIDKVHGGFGSAPKFPHTTNINFMLKNCNMNDIDLKDKLNLTLRRMCLSGLYDQIGGGFFRYSVDELWMIPHFEKMLYDNGPMLEVLCKGYRKLNDDIYLYKINQTCSWLINTMQDNNGGFYSTIDADSENIEGKYYVWDEIELQELLDENQYSILKETFFVYNKPNFEGKYHFHVTKINEENYKNNISEFEAIKNKLIDARNKRIAPGIDKKILVSWNSLAITGLLESFKLTGKTKYYESARKCFDFIKQRMWKDDKLYACFHDEPCFDGYLDDYAYLSKNCIEFLKINWNEDDFTFLQKLIKVLINNFQDKKNGGFFFTSNNHEELIYRPKTYSDESLPSGNSIATDACLELALITGNNLYLNIVDDSLKSASDSIKRSSASHCSLLSVGMDLISSKKLIVIRCDENILDEYKAKIFNIENSFDSFYFIKNNFEGLSDAMKDKKSIGSFTAYICKDFVCSSPINSFEDLLNYLA